MGEKASEVGTSLNETVIKPSSQQVSQELDNVASSVSMHSSVMSILSIPQVSKFGTYVNNSVIKPTKQKVPLSHTVSHDESHDQSHGRYVRNVVYSHSRYKKVTCGVI